MAEMYPCRLMCLPATALPWVEVLGELEDEGLISLKRLICWRDDMDRYVEMFPNARIDTVEDAWFGRYTSSERNGRADSLQIGEDVYWLAYRMLNRQESTPGSISPLMRRELILSAWQYWLNVLSDIDLVLSPSIPHRFFDYLCFEAAKERGIKVVTFQATSIDNFIIPLTGIDSVPEQAFAVSETNHDEEARVVQYIQGRLSCPNNEAPWYMQAHRKNKRLTSRLRSSFTKFTKAAYSCEWHKFLCPNTYWYHHDKPVTSWLRFFMLLLLRSIQRHRLERSFSAVVQVRSVPDRQFILVALHYQPEETTCPSAFRFGDQLEILKVALQLGDKNSDVLVKEHPNQFDAHMEGVCGRRPDFYSNAMSLSPRIRFCDQISNQVLLHRASLVLTATGTIGWEAALQGVPVVHFGRAWYEGMPLTHRYRDTPRAREFAAESQVSREQSDYLDWAVDLSKLCLPADHYKNPKSSDQVDSKKNLKRVLQTMITEEC